jgi:EmrB/QacA subfamily drug resistance transporter
MARRDRFVLATCCMSLFIGGMDATVVNLGLPAIQTDLHASLTDLQWVIDIYSLGVASLQMLTGATGDRLGRKRIFQVGLVVFTTASLLCGLAPNLAWLVTFRGMQAVGASMLNPLAMSIITSVFTDPGQRARAIGIWSGVLGASLGLGPFVGGFLIGSVGWRAIFWINIPLGVAALVLTTVLVPESRAAQPRPVDPVGQLLIAALIGGVTFAIIEAPRTGWLSTRADVAAGVALAAGVAFVPYEIRHRNPMLDLRFFRRARFSGAIAIGVLSNGGFYSFLFVASLYLQQARGHSPIVAGVYLLPIGVMTAVFAPLTGSLIARAGPRRPLALAGLLLSGGAALMALGVSRQSDVLVLLSFTATAAGFGFVNAPITYIAVGEMPAEQAGVAAATTSTSRLIGSALGIAVIGSVLAERTSGSTVNGFSAASGPCWWIMAGCGLAVLGISAVASGQSRALDGGRRAVELAPTGTL